MKRELAKLKWKQKQHHPRNILQLKAANRKAHAAVNTVRAIEYMVERSK